MSKILKAVLTALVAVKHLVLGRPTELTDGAISYPGHLAFANKGGEYFHGCKVKKFRTVRGLNEFFLPGNEGHLTLVAEILPVLGGFLLVYTKKLSHEDMEDVEEFNRNMHSYFADQKEKRNAEKLKEQEAKARQEAETKRLAEVGRKLEARVAKARTLEAGGLERKGLEKQIAAGILDDEQGTP